jgi:uncharacterized membrane protein YhhN
MTHGIYRTLGAACFLTAAVISILNLGRTMNLGWKTIPLLFMVLGAIMFIRAKKARTINSGK